MEKLENLKKEIESTLSDYSLDFINTYRIEDNCYISDCINEFADNNTSIYYSDQKEFYYNNEDLCNNALIELGYDLNQMIKNGSSLDDLICKAGAIGEYCAIENTLNSELEDIIKLMIINYVIENNIKCDIDILDNIDCYQIERFSDLIDLVKEYNQE